MGWTQEFFKKALAAQAASDRRMYARDARYKARYDAGVVAARRGKAPSPPYKSDGARSAWLSGYYSVRSK